MAWQSGPEILPLVVSGTLCAGLAAYAWRHRRVPAAREFVLLMAASAWWSLFYALYRASASFSTRLLLAQAVQAGAIMVPLAWAVFALRFTGRRRWLAPLPLAALCAVPLLTLVMAATNSLHLAFWSRFELVERNGRAAIDSEPAWGFWLHVIFSWALLSLAVALVLHRAVRGTSVRRAQAAAVAVAAAVPWIGNVLHVTETVRFPANPMPVLFTLTGAVFFWAIFRLRLLDLVPVARAALVEEMADGVVVVHQDGHVLDANPAARRLLGGMDGDRPGPDVLAPLASLLAGDPRTSAEARVTLGTMESPRVVDVRVTPLHDRWGQVNGRLLVLRDLTESERREGVLALQRAYLEQLFDAAPEGLALLDSGDRVLDVNPEWTRLFGYSPDEARHRPINDLIVPEELHDEGQSITLQVASGARAEVETVRRRKDGQRCDVQVLGAPVFTSGVQVGTWGIYRDISERKHQERSRAELLERERLARADAEAASRRAAFLADVGTLLSAAFNTGTGYGELARLAVPELADYCLIDEATPEGGTRRVAIAHALPEGERMLLRDAQNPPDADPARRPALRVIRSGEPVMVAEVTPDVVDSLAHDEAHREAFQAVRPRSLLIVPLTARGRTLGAITLAYAHSGRRYGPAERSTAEDMARRAALAIDNARLYREAREAIRARDTVLGVVSHDLRNPLSSILLHAESLLMDASVQGWAREGAAQVVRSVEAMERMIRDLLDVARIEAGQLRVEPLPLGPGVLLREAASLLGGLAEERGIALRVQAPAEGPPVRADRDRILQVFSNLVGNALKFTPSGGEVVIGAERAEGEVRFWVRDTGPGIAAADQPHLWQRFWQADGPERRAGAGLGLPIVHGIVQAHGGECGVDSRPGAGATFWFTLPG
ncbi:MAG TPA: histidine kinase N-terminal 7TM domain-containing protein [Longimicrobium sp.]|uniref:histidine kinase N-terminal 7TM domain-containing protein n=1 Tax=Longimicrobium sp. TaxID=2029185 RepID=UPI002ED82C92